MLLHAKLLNLKTFKDILKALIFFKDLNQNCDDVVIFKDFSWTFKDFKDPWGPCYNNL